MDNYFLSLIRGDSFSFGLDFEGLDQDLETAFFSVKKNAKDEAYSFQKSLGNGITKQETNKYVIRVAPEDTAGLEAGKYVFDLQIGVNGDIFTPMIGIFNLVQDVTNVTE